MDSAQVDQLIAVISIAAKYIQTSDLYDFSHEVRAILENSVYN